jgi:hypothetical protein
MGHHAGMRASMVLLLSLTCGAAAAADARCTAQLRADQARIERELAATAPRKGDLHAEQQFSARMHALLEAAADKHDACERAARPVPTPADKAAQQARAGECDATARRRLEELDQRMRGRPNPPMAEQAAAREEQTRIVDERMRCMRAVR